MRPVGLASLVCLMISCAAPASAQDFPVAPAELAPAIQEAMEQAPLVVVVEEFPSNLPQPEYTAFAPASEPEITVPDRQSFITRVCGAPEPPPCVVVYQPEQSFDGFSALVRNPYDPQPVPEPGTMLAVGAGLIGLIARRRRK